MSYQSYGWEAVLNSYGGNCYRFTKQTLERLTNPNYLDGYGYKVYSQNDEDGIIQEIFVRIGMTNRVFVEFGVESGLESNCHYLLLQGWSGLWIEGDENNYWRLRYCFYPAIETGQLKAVNQFIKVKNINKIISDSGISGEIDLLSVDIDGNDYHVLNAIEVIRPRVVVVEYNGKFPPPMRFCMPYNENHIYDGTDNHGASLASMTTMMNDKGYQLVGTNVNGVNAFFVRDDLIADKFPYTKTAGHLYNPLRLGSGTNLLMFRSGAHPSRYFLGGTSNIKKILPLQPACLCDIKQNPHVVLWGAGKCGIFLANMLRENGISDIVYCDTRKQDIWLNANIINYQEMENLYSRAELKPMVLITASKTIWEMAYRCFTGGIISVVYHVLPLFDEISDKCQEVINLRKEYAKTLKSESFFSLPS